MLSRLFGPPVPQIDPFQAQSKLAENSAPLLLDVRQPEEYQAGHISGAKLIPLPELNRRMRELSHSRAIICVCHTGSRSRSASRQLLAAGYNVTNLKGGMIGWQRAGLPVKKGSSR